MIEERHLTATAEKSSDRAEFAAALYEIDGEDSVLLWLRLSAVLEEAGAVPCRTSDPEAWWPDKKSVDGPATRMAVAARWRCPAVDARLTYAVAAGEREGIWGATVPDEREVMQAPVRLAS